MRKLVEPRITSPAPTASWKPTRSWAIPSFTQNNAKHLLGPRVGLAWDPFGNGKTAIRAGFGTYYSLIDDLSFLLNSLPPL